MIDKVQAYSTKSSLSFQGNVINKKIISNKEVSEALDMFVTKPQKKETFAENFKNIFFEIFPSLHSTYRRMMGKQKPFRLPVNEEFVVHDGKKYVRKINAAKEFYNPDAESIYKQIKKTSNPKEKAYLRNQLGEYKLIDLKQEKIMDKFLKNRFI